MNIHKSSHKDRRLVNSRPFNRRGVLGRLFPASSGVRDPRGRSVNSVFTLCVKVADQPPRSPELSPDSQPPQGLFSLSTLHPPLKPVFCDSFSTLIGKETPSPQVTFQGDSQTAVVQVS